MRTKLKRNTSVTSFLAAAWLFLISHSALAQTASISTVVEGLNSPWAIEFISETEILVTERDGKLRLIRDGILQDSPIDGTPEALYIKDAPGFTLAVQWHPEWRADIDPVSRPLFEAFGKAAQAWAMGEVPMALSS